MSDDRTRATPTSSGSGRLSASGSGEWARRHRVGDRVGGYVLERELGEGGMGTVFVARHVTTGQESALKVMLVDLDVNVGALERFRREGQAQAAGGKHPNVLVVHSAGEQAGFAYIVMELARGGDLKARLRQGPLEPRAAAELIAGLARGLAHVHAHGVLHRDIKPGNVVFAEDGTPKLMDFGLASLAGSDKLTKTGTMLGTPAYMAPEQAGGEPLDERADVYALGAVLYHCLTGRPPFDGDSMFVLVRKVITQPVTPPSQVVPSVPLALDQLVMRVLAKDPAQRFPTAAALADELDTFVRGELVAKPPTGRRVALALGLVGALSALGLGAAFAMRRPAAAPVGSSTDGAVAAGRKPPLRETTIVTPPLGEDGEHVSLREWSLVDHQVDHLDVETTQRVRSLLRVEHIDVKRAVGVQTVTKVSSEALAVGEHRTRVPLAVGWTSIALVTSDGRGARRHVVRLPPTLERVARTTARARKDGSELRLVPPGRLENRALHEPDGRSPMAEVTGPYLLGAYEVTWGQYRQYRSKVPDAYLPQSKPANTDRDEQPVNNVSLFDAYGYCDWAGLRLPEDLEWELAALDQTQWNEEGPPVPDVSCAAADRESFPGARARWGHWHLIGNLCEWTQAIYYFDPDGTELKLAGMFGGGFYGTVPRRANYESHETTARMSDTGFRVAHSVSGDRGYFFRYEQE